MSDTEFLYGVMAKLVFAFGVCLYGSAAVLTFVLNETRLVKVEPLPRNKWIGLVAGWIALAVCVPHAAVVSPAFLLPFLWPIAIIVPILGFFFVDYPAARALGGILILMGYYLVHYTFDFRTPGFPVLAVAGWLIGIAGIWISGKPCSMRDYLRLAGRSRSFRLSCGAAWSIAALLSLWALIMTGTGGAA